MKCPHCQTAFHDRFDEINLGEDIDGEWVLRTRSCPECEKSVFHLARLKRIQHDGKQNVHIPELEYLVRPKGAVRPQPQRDVPSEFADDYREASLVLADSSKASAALSRRCLQHLLREVAKVKPGNLADEIQQVLDSHALPTHIANSIDAVRNIGNFAAHPMKSTSSGEILPVEPGEAEWNLDVLDTLFDFYFVQPAVLQRRKDALNTKLKSAGKPPMK